MPLNPGILTQQLNAFMNEKSSMFTGFPKNQQDLSMKWSNAIAMYAQGMVPPSASTAMAKSSLQSSLLSATQPGSFIPALTSGIVSFTNSIIPGMLPLFIGVPPAGSPNFSTIPPLGLNGAPSAVIVSQFTTIIDAYFKTGTFSTVTPTGVIFSGFWL